MLHVVAAVALSGLDATALTVLLALVLGRRRRLPRATTVVLLLLFANMAVWVVPGTVRNLAGDGLVAAVGAVAATSPCT